VDNESMTLPSSLMRQFISNTFVETGSYDGRTIQQALDCGYKHVISIELGLSYYQTCQRRFEGDDRVTLYFGDSCKMLPKMLSGIQTPATLWLDAHIQEDIVGDEPAPILAELAIIARSKVVDHTIMIDDRRLMGQGWWAKISEANVLYALQLINPNYKIEYFDSKAASKDIIVAHM
jgi:hypothetical protein